MEQQELAQVAKPGIPMFGTAPGAANINSLF